MKTILVTNIENEQIEIKSFDLQKFKEVVMFDNNFEKCEIFVEGDKAGWHYLRTALETIESREIGYNDEDLEGILENFFECHLFPELV